MTREDGFYWVKWFVERGGMNEPEWIVAEWLFGEFYCTGDENTIDEYILEIDEQRILRKKSNEPDFSVQPPELN